MASARPDRSSSTASLSAYSDEAHAASKVNCVPRSPSAWATSAAGSPAGNAFRGSVASPGGAVMPRPSSMNLPRTARENDDDPSVGRTMLPKMTPTRSRSSDSVRLDFQAVCAA